jgi:single-stranded DNA-binding protein
MAGPGGDVQLRSTHSGKTVASHRSDPDAHAVYVDLIVWEAHADAAAKHLTKGQAVSFAGRFEPREYMVDRPPPSGSSRVNQREIRWG